MSLLYQNYVVEKFDEKGTIKELDFRIPDNFNFGYDVVDVLGTEKPDKRAMIWLSKNKEEKVFTYGDMKKYSTMTANYFKSLGIQKGDRVMLILKRHYQFWFSIVALHKIGAIVIPATNLLTKKDLVYRFNAAGVKAVVCTPDGEVADHVDASIPESPTVKIKIMVNGARGDWEDFDQGIQAQPDEMERMDTNKDEIMLMYFTSGTTGYPKIAAHKHTYAIGHIATAAYWHNVEPDGLHLTVSDTGWGKAVWGKLYGQWFCESCSFCSMILTSLYRS